MTYLDTLSLKFVDLAMLRLRRRPIWELSPEDLRIVWDVVSQAGFDPKEIVPGELSAEPHLINEAPRRTMVNRLCKFRVINRKGRINYFATGWLDCAFRAVHIGIKNNETRRHISDALAHEIRRSVPLSPIRLSNYGDLLLEHAPTPNHFSPLGYFVDHLRDESQLCSVMGIHNKCWMFMDRKPASYPDECIVCRACQFIAVFPRETRTYGEFRNKVLISADKW